MWLDYKVLIFARFTKVWNFNKSEDLGHRSTGTTIKAFFVSEREREKGRKRERERERERKRNESFEVLSVVFLVATVRWPYTGNWPLPSTRARRKLPSKSPVIIDQNYRVI